MWLNSLIRVSVLRSPAGHSPLKVRVCACAVLDYRSRLFDVLANVTVVVSNAPVIQRLPAKQADLVPPLARTPELKVIVIWILNLQLA